MTTRIIGGTGIEFPDATQQGTRGVPNDAPVLLARQFGDQGLAGAQYTTVIYNEEVDTHDAWDGTTYTPPVAGYYQINASVSVSTPQGGLISIFKNGVEYRRGVQADTTGITVSALVELNGETDSVSIRVRPPATVATNSGLSYLDIHLVRAL